MAKVIMFFLLLLVVLLGAGFFLFSQKSDFSGAGSIVEMMVKTVSKDVDINAKFAIYDSFLVQKKGRNGFIS